MSTSGIFTYFWHSTYFDFNLFNILDFFCIFLARFFIKIWRICSGQSKWTISLAIIFLCIIRNMKNPIKTKQLGSPSTGCFCNFIWRYIYLFLPWTTGCSLSSFLLFLLSLHSSNTKENELTLGSYLYPAIPIVSLLYEAFSLNGSSWPNVMMHFKLKLNLF